MSPLVTTLAGVTVKAYGLTRGAASDFRAFFVSTSNLTRWLWNADTSGNLYAGGTINGVSSNILKIDSLTGTVTWQKANTTRQYTAGNTRTVVVENSTGLVAFANSTGSAPGAHFLLTSSGSIQYQREINGGSSGVSMSSFPRGLDTSGNLYGAIATTGSQFVVVKYNSSGSLQWQRQVVRAGSDIYYYRGCVVDSSSNVYAASGGLDNGSSIWFGTIVKYNSSGTIQWQRSLYSGSNFVVQNINSQSTGNLATQINTSSSNRFITSLVNSSTGDGIWYRELTGVTGVNSHGVAIDQSSNVYSVGRVGNTEIYIAKYNSSGSLQWQRKITGSVGLDFEQLSIQVVDSLNYLISFGSSTGGFCMKLPQDGSLTGTYVLGGQTITYATTTALSDAAFTSVTYSSLGLTDSAASQNFATPSYTFSDTTYALTEI